MGCSAERTQEAWFNEMEELEMKIMLYGGLEEKQIHRDFVKITMDDKPFDVRVIEINKETKGEKKTLVLLHGYMGSAATFGPFLTETAKHFHVVAFDHGNFGLNTRTFGTNALKGVDEAE